MPGIGLTVQWRVAHWMPKGLGSAANLAFFPALALSIVFRGKFMAVIIAAHAAGQLQPDKRQEQLPANGFIQRFMQHVLPSGLKRIRHYGRGWSIAKKSRIGLIPGWADNLPQATC